MVTYLTNESVCGPTTAVLSLEQNSVLLNQSVVRTKTGAELATGLLGLLGGIVSALRMVARAYTSLFKWWKRRKGKEELPLALVPLVDNDGSDDWTAQKIWNQSISDRIRSSESRLDSAERMHRRYDARLESIELMHERFEKELKQFRNMAEKH